MTNQNEPDYPPPPDKYPDNLGIPRRELSMKEAWVTLKDAMESDLIYGTKDTDEFVRDARYAKALFYSGGDDRRTPLYSAMYALSTDKKLNIKSAPEIAARLEHILEEVDMTYGKSTVVNMGNTICFSHAMDLGKRDYTETLHDLLNENNKLAPFFAPVIKRFQLLPHSEVIQEKLPHAERVKDIDFRGSRPRR